MYRLLCRTHMSMGSRVKGDTNRFYVSGREGKKGKNYVVNCRSPSPGVRPLSPAMSLSPLRSPPATGSHAEWLKQDLLGAMDPEDRWSVVIATAPRIPRRRLKRVERSPVLETEVLAGLGRTWQSWTPPCHCHHHPGRPTRVSPRPPSLPANHSGSRNKRRYPVPNTIPRSEASIHR